MCGRVAADRQKRLQVQVFVTDRSTNVLCGCGVFILGDAQKLLDVVLDMWPLVALPEQGFGPDDLLRSLPVCDSVAAFKKQSIRKSCLNRRS